jgi:hypothetical protein
MTIAGNIAVIPGGRAIADSSETQGPFGRKKEFCLERTLPLPGTPAGCLAGGGRRRGRRPG